MKHSVLWLFGLLVLISSVWAASSVSQQTEGPCSPAVAVGQGNVTIECKDVDRNELNELIKIFNEGVRSFKEFQTQLLERQPDISVVCRPDDKGHPSKLVCSVLNAGRGEGRDLIISFAELLPVNTIIQAPPELGIRLEEAGSPPDPRTSPTSAKVLTAFVVRIPRVAPKERFDFTLRTIDNDNLRAAKQVLKIRQEIHDTP